MTDEARVTQPTTDPTLGMRIAKCPHCGEELSVWADRPPEPPTLPWTQSELAEALSRRNGSNVGMAEYVIESLRALGASPPPPDLSEAWHEAVAALPEGWTEIIVWWHPERTTVRAHGPNVSEDPYHPRSEEVAAHEPTPDAALRELARLLASQPPSTPREP